MASVRLRMAWRLAKMPRKCSEEKKKEILENLWSKMKWEYVNNCNFCGSHEKTVYMNEPNKNFHGRGLYLAECSNCNLVYNEYRPKFEYILEMFENEELSTYRFVKKLERSNVNLIHRRFVREAMSYGSFRSLFDVGTGAGTILIEGRKLGLAVAGNEINTVSCRWLNQNGFLVYKSPTINLELDDSFDIIMCLDYIEHSYTPFDDLKWAYKHTNENGVLYLKTLWLGCPNHKIMGKNWNLFGGMHFHYYYPKVIIHMLEKAGFRVISDKRSAGIIHLVGRKR